MTSFRKHPLYGPLDFDGIFATTWALYKKHFSWLFLYSFLFSLVLSLPGIYLIDMDSLIEMQTTPNLQALSSMTGNLFLYLVTILLGYSLLYLLLHHFIIRKEEEPRLQAGTLFMESVTKHYLPYLVVMIITGLLFFAGIFLGIFLLVIGSLLAAVYLGTVFFPVTPTLIVEKRDPFATIGRCFSLVHGYFWPTVGQVLVFMILYLIVSFLLGILASAPYAGNLFQIMSHPEAAGEMIADNRFINMQNPLMILLNAAVSGALLPFIPAFATTLYFNLRAREDERSPFPERTEED